MKALSLEDVVDRLDGLRASMDELRRRVERIEGWLGGVAPAGQLPYRAHPGRPVLGPAEQRRSYEMAAARARCYNRRLGVEARADAISEAIRMGALPIGFTVDDVYAKWRESEGPRAAPRSAKPRRARIPSLQDLLAPAGIDFIARATAITPTRESIRFPIWMVMRLGRLPGMQRDDKVPLDRLWRMACVAERRQALGDRARVLYKGGQPLVDDAGALRYPTGQIFRDPRTPDRTWYASGTPATHGNTWYVPHLHAQVRADDTLFLPDATWLRSGGTWWNGSEPIAYDVLLAKIRKLLGRKTYLEVQAGLDALADDAGGLHALAILELAWALQKRRLL